MKKLLISILTLCCILTTQAQQKKKNQGSDTVINKIDSIISEETKENINENIPIVSLDEDDLSGKTSQDVSSLLTAGKDPFLSAAAFNFSIARFKMRGYDGDNFNTYINNVPVENIDNGFTPFGLWGGLNDVLYNRDVSIGLRYSTFAFGDIGTTTNIDVRASKQRKQTQIDYAYSDRNYTHKFSITHSTGINKKGWAFTFSGSRRWADEGYIPGTYYNGWSYFMSIDKHFGKKHTLSFAVFGAPTEYGKQGAATAEAFNLAGSHYYNPDWGYQNGKKRNANVAKTNQPVLLLTHDYKINNKSNLVSGLLYSFGEKSSSSLDWYNAPDPRPDYYQYLPSWYAGDQAIVQQMDSIWRNDQNVRQINWANLYDANKSNTETVNGVTGHRSRYILQEAVTNTRKINLNTAFNTAINNHVKFTAGASYQYLKNNYFKRVNDLLGGDYFVDVNQFAERDFPLDSIGDQNDLNHPNRIVHAGDKYGYDYDINIRKASGWAQSVFTYNHLDYFVAVQLSNTQFWRVGNMKNGLFPNNSLGKSSTYNFNNYAVKGGITYKLDGRNYFYANAAVLTKAPFFDNVYLSPRTRDITQPNIKSEENKSIEGGYVLNAPKIKLRITGYYTEFNNQMDVKSYYDDIYRTFVNAAISGINKVHFGSELGFEAKVMPNVTLNGAAAIGRYYYNSRQNLTITKDNAIGIIDSGIAYTNNYRVGGTPQEAYSLGISYHSPKYWFVSLTGNYFDQMWIDINPMRRTYNAVQDVTATSKERNDILSQEELAGQFTLDFYGGYSWKLPKKYAIHQKNTFLVFNAGISNLLNNKNIVAGGYEQLRYGLTTESVQEFPPKYYYAYGINYFISAAFRF